MKISYNELICKVFEEEEMKRLKLNPEINSFFIDTRNIVCEIDIQRTLIYKYDELISIDLILDIIDNYKISKRNLSLLLGWGELTITRYLKGSIPSFPKSKLLKEILYSPKYYYMLLFLNRHRISYNAFKKSELAAKKYIIDLEKKNV